MASQWARGKRSEFILISKSTENVYQMTNKYWHTIALIDTDWMLLFKILLFFAFCFTAVFFFSFFLYLIFLYH